MKHAFLIAATLAVITTAFSADAGDRWRAQHVQDEESAACDVVCAWVRDLKQPDHPNTTCCAEADRYEADDYERGPNGETIAIITDGKGEIVNGTKVVVPDGKMKWDDGNPTGRGQIFMHLSAEFAPYVYCYVPGSGA